MAGRQLHADRDRQGLRPATTWRSRPQIQGVVNSVDLTQSPPLLSIGGQTYTVNQIKRIVNRPQRPPARSSQRLSAQAAPDHDPSRPGVARTPGRSALHGIFKEIRIEALGLGKF